MLPMRRAIGSAREMRQNLTPPEARLWVALRGKALSGLRFRRQHPIGPLILISTVTAPDWRSRSTVCSMNGTTVRRGTSAETCGWSGMG